MGSAVRLEKLAEKSGFSYWKNFDTSILELRDEVRQMCASDLCHAYGRRWTCPPACGTLEELRQTLALYPVGILVQTVGALEDPFDYEGMKRTEHEQKEHFFSYVRQARMEGLDILPLSSGACELCDQCTYPDKGPCCHPELAWPSMEAWGLLVGDVCGKAGLQYYYGPNKIAFTACILTKDPA